MISCLNVLDRCSHPIDLLTQFRKKLAKDGYLVVAFAYPFAPYVEMGTSTVPAEHLKITGSTFEDQAQSFSEIMDSIGFEMISFSKLPYLCEGDMSAPYYLLEDSVFVFKVKN